MPITIPLPHIIDATDLADVLSGFTESEIRRFARELDAALRDEDEATADIFADEMAAIFASEATP